MKRMAMIALVSAASSVAAAAVLAPAERKPPRAQNLREFALRPSPISQILPTPPWTTFRTDMPVID